MSTKAHVLSSAQREVLLAAVRHDKGRIRRCTITTQRILESCGFIEKAYHEKDEQSRQSLAADRDTFIGKAQELLARNCWQEASLALDEANYQQRDLNRQAYWITDAGRAAVEGK